MCTFFLFMSKVYTNACRAHGHVHVHVPSRLASNGGHARRGPNGQLCTCRPHVVVLPSGRRSIRKRHCFRASLHLSTHGVGLALLYAPLL